MAASLAAGAAGLLRQLHPDWGPETVKSALVGSASLPGTTRKFSPIDVGAGRLDLFAASNATLAAYPPVLAMGQTAPGDFVEETVEIRDLESTSDNTLTVSWEHVEHAEHLTAVPQSGAHVEPGEEFEVRITASSTAPAGEYSGYLKINGTDPQQTVTVPYHFRLLPVRHRSLMLLDMSFQEQDSALAQLYSQMADEAGIDWEMVDTARLSRTLELAELLRYKTVLVFTGDDQNWHTSPVGLATLDVLENYVRKGGRLIVAGQGPWRGAAKARLSEMLGISTDSGFPMLDPNTQQIIALYSYLSYPIDGTIPLTLPVDLDPMGDGQGNLALAGELNEIWGAGLPDLWVKPFLYMPGYQFQAGGRLGMVFDPYMGYGAYYEAEALSTRVVFMGFGFERVNSESLETTSRQELFQAVYDWVSDEIAIAPDAMANGLKVTVEVKVEQGDAVSFAYDFGDGSDIVTSSYYRASHIYDSYGEKEIEVVARSRLGSAAIEQINVDLEENGEDAGPDETDASVPDQIVSTETRDCQCRAIGGFAPTPALHGLLWDLVDI
jgi:hypothetical protein